MKRTSIVAAAVAALSLPAFASGPGRADAAAAAQRTKLVTSAQAELGVLPADGKMGPQTHAALKEFQRAKGLEPSGQLDQKTVTALGLDGPKPSPADSERAAKAKSKHAAPTGEAK